MLAKALFTGLRSTANRLPALLRPPGLGVLSCCTLLLSFLSGCSWEELSSAAIPTVPNAVAVDRALQLCSLTHSDQPFHLILQISPPSLSRSGAPNALEMHAEVELYWLNAITYRTVIHSRNFSQTRIVNGSVVEEHNTGDFYPRWIQNFVDALLDPVPKAAALRKVPGAVPVSRESHACISNPAGDLSSSQVCFQDEEPRIASGIDFTRYVSFDDFQPFGSQQIPRTLINDLPANFLVRGRIVLLEALPSPASRLLKAHEFTLPARQIRTVLVSKATAQSLMESNPAIQSLSSYHRGYSTKISYSPRDTRSSQPSPQGPTTIYVRTDRTGRVREAYRDSTDIYGLQSAALNRALSLKFKPLLVNGIPHQMEAPIDLSSESMD